LTAYIYISKKAYIGREDAIVAFAYRLHIGDVDINTLTITEPKMNLAKDLDEFYSQTGLAFYDQGYLFFRVEDINPNSRKIKYDIAGFGATGVVEKIHVWNVFDEFATFVGIERHVGETNAELEQRILNVFKRRTNSTEQGLKNTILNELAILDPTLTEEEIDISKPTPENLVKYYKEFGSVIEKLAHVNRDVYRTKRWDLDAWDYALKSVDYIPHAWDIAIEAYQNGVGFEDDLNVALTKPDDTTNARVTFFSESSSKVQEYVKRKDIKTNIDLKLTQYDNLLNPVAAKYKITASEAKDITAAPIMIECSETISGEQERYIQDIITSDIKDIEVVDKSVISADKNYKLVFSSTEDYGYMNIEACDLITNGVAASLLNEKNGFVFNTDGVLYNKNVKLHITQKHQLLNYSNIANVTNGMTIDDLSRDASMAIDITGMANEYFKTEYSCQTTPLSNTFIKRVGFELYNLDSITTIPNAIEKYVEIEVIANQVTFDMIEGNYTIDVTTPKGTVTTIGNGAKKIETALNPTPVNHVIRITPIGSNPVTLNNIRYSKFEINFALAKGAFANINGNMVLPQDNSNLVYINMKTYTGYSPVVEFIHVGPSIANAKYETNIITAAAGTTRKLRIKTNCQISLVEVDAQGNAIPAGTINNYEPYNEYKAISDQAYIKLNVNEYSQIDYIKGSVGRFERRHR
jgi:hypothetical protein